MIWSVGVLYLIVFLAVSVFGLFIVRHARETGNFDAIKAKASALRKVWFMVLVVAFAVAIGKSLYHLPYEEFVKRRGAEPNFLVSAVGQTWSWVLSSDTVPLDRYVEFRVTSTDVNHGFAIYNDNDVLVGQVQAMPGYVNNLILKFDQPGEYRILCLEYCGTGHHRMITRFQVVPNQSLKPKIVPEGWPNSHRAMKVIADAQCLSCHTTRGAQRLGLSWRGLRGATRTLNSGETITVDDSYLRRAILDHDSEIVKGFLPGLVWSYSKRLTSNEAGDIIEYIKSLR